MRSNLIRGVDVNFVVLKCLHELRLALSFGRLALVAGGVGTG